MILDLQVQNNMQKIVISENPVFSIFSRHAERLKKFEW